MNGEARHGNQILKCKATAAQTLGKRLLYIIPALIFIAVGIVSYVKPELFDLADEDMAMVLALFFGAGAVFLLLGIFFVKSAAAVLYEGGFVLTRGSKVTEMDFGDLKGILDSTTILKYYGILPVGKTRVVTVYKKNGEKFGVVKAFVPDFNRFVDELNAAITNYYLKDVTLESMKRLNIYFSDKLELIDGQFIHDAGSKKGKVSIPVEVVRSIEYLNDDGYWLSIKGAPAGNGKANELISIRADKTLNLDTLSRIIQMVSENK